MWVLLRDYIVRDIKLRWIPIAVALAFALTPFWPSGMLSTLGHPIALWTLLNIRKAPRFIWKNQWVNVLILVVLPFYSSFVLGFFFFLFSFSVFTLVDFIRKRKVHLPLFLALSGMTVLYLAIDYRLVCNLVSGGAPSSRSVFHESKLSLHETLQLALKNFVYGHTHDITLHGPILLPLLLVMLMTILVRRTWRAHRLFLGLMLLNAVLSLWYAFWFYKGWVPIKAAHPFLNSFNFARFHFLRPLLIYVLFALGLSWAWKDGRIGKAIAIGCVVAQLALLGAFNDQFVYATKPTVRQFYATQQFEKIATYIGAPKHTYRIGCIGFHPAIAEYNGFYTLDMYVNFYPLSYKRQFQAIIEPELQKNEALDAYFDDWGERVYLYPAELNGKMKTKKNHKHIQHLQLNTRAFAQLGGKYILSAVPIDHPQADQLRYLHTFRDKQSAWTIYLYAVQ
jgi:hypothetical protein